MFNHHERDHLVRQSIHEHTGFIKNCEGYPQYIFDNAQIENKFRFTQQSEEIGILDFYESLSCVSKVIAAVQRSFLDTIEAHRPDNGLLTTLLERSMLHYLSAELEVVDNQANLNYEKQEGLQYIDDNSIIGNPDKILFYTKELAASARDGKQA